MHTIKMLLFPQGVIFFHLWVCIEVPSPGGKIDGQRALIGALRRLSRLAAFVSHFLKKCLGQSLGCSRRCQSPGDDVKAPAHRGILKKS